MKLTFKNNASDAVFEINLTDTILTADDITRVANDVPAEYTDLYIPEGVTELSDYCLSSLDHISAIYLPSTLEVVTARSFNFLPIEEVVVHPNNKLLCSLNGVLYSKDLSALIYYPQNKSDERFITPESVVTIKSGAFAAVKNLRHFTATKDVAILEKSCFTASAVESVDLSACDKMITIPSCCFTLCRNLKTVLLPQNLKYIEKLAFDMSAITYLDIPNSVERIRKTALSRNSLQIAKLPKNLKILDDRVFAGCKELVTLDLSMARSIHKKTISGCSKLREFLCDEGNDSFSAIDGILYDKHGVLLKCPPAYASDVLYVPDGTKTIDLAFDSNICLKEVFLPESLEEIKRGAFYHCEKLESVHLGKYCKTIDLFDYCFNVNHITIDEENPYLRSIDDVVFSKDMRTLIYYPRGKTEKQYIIPDGVEEIAKEAFAFVQVEEVVLPNTLRIISSSAFENSKLKRINIPQSVELIGTSSFAFCQLEKIEIPSNTLIYDYAFMGNPSLQVYMKGNVIRMKYSFALTPFHDKKIKTDARTLNEILNKIERRSKPINRFENSKRYWGINPT